MSSFDFDIYTFCPTSGFMKAILNTHTHTRGIVENICFAFSFAIVPYLLCVALLLHKHVFVSLDLCFMVFCTCLLAASTSLYYISLSLGRSTKKTKYSHICLSLAKRELNWWYLHDHNPEYTGRLIAITLLLILRKHCHRLSATTVQSEGCRKKRRKKCGLLQNQIGPFENT